MNKKRDENVACKHLSSEDNELIFNQVGGNSFSLCTAIVELYHSNQSTHSAWEKISVGALCFEKDYEKRSYFFRLYCLMRHELVWQQEIYRNLNLSLSRSYLLTFEGDVSRINCLKH